MAAIGAMMAGCQSGSRALTPYGRDIDSICHCQERSGALERPEGERPLIVAQGVSSAIQTDEARSFLARLSQSPPRHEAAVPPGAARRVGLPACPLADVWSAPPAP